MMHAFQLVGQILMTVFLSTVFSEEVDYFNTGNYYKYKRNGDKCEVSTLEVSVLFLFSNFLSIVTVLVLALKNLGASLSTLIFLSWWYCWYWLLTGSYQCCAWNKESLWNFIDEFSISECIYSGHGTDLIDGIQRVVMEMKIDDYDKLIIWN